MDIITSLWLGAAAIGITGLLWLIVKVHHERKRAAENTAITLAEIADEKRQRERDERNDYIRVRRQQIEAENVARRERQLAEREKLHANWDAVKKRMPDRADKAGHR